MKTAFFSILILLASCDDPPITQKCKYKVGELVELKVGTTWVVYRTYHSYNKESLPSYTLKLPSGIVLPFWTTQPQYLFSVYENEIKGLKE